MSETHSWPPMQSRANQRARAKGLPLYYVKDGYLVEERRGKFKKLARITRNELFD